jgi:hypothetical protein
MCRLLRFVACQRQLASHPGVMHHLMQQQEQVLCSCLSVDGTVDSPYWSCLTAQPSLDCSHRSCPLTPLCSAPTCITCSALPVPLPLVSPALPRRPPHTRSLPAVLLNLLVLLACTALPALLSSILAVSAPLTAAIRIACKVLPAPTGPLHSCPVLFHWSRLLSPP